jgi:hypothetical protein
MSTKKPVALIQFYIAKTFHRIQNFHFKAHPRFQFARKNLLINNSFSLTTAVAIHIQWNVPISSLINPRNYFPLISTLPLSRLQMETFK